MLSQFWLARSLAVCRSEGEMKSAIFLLFLTISVVGDEYLFNVKTWVKPVLDVIPEGAKRGMDSVAHLHHFLSPDDKAIYKLDSVLRKKVAEHLAHEMRFLTDKMQILINIVKDFSLEMVSALQEVVAELSQGDGAAPSQVAKFRQRLISRSQGAIDQILTNLGHTESKDMEEHLSAHVFKKLSIQIARKVLKISDPIAVERSVLKQMEDILNAVLSNRKGEMTVGLMEDVEAALDAFTDFHPQLADEQTTIKAWTKELVLNAVDGAKPQITLLRHYLKQVINDACQLCHDVCSQAYNFFSAKKEALGKEWDSINSILLPIVLEKEKI